MEKTMTTNTISNASADGPSTNAGSGPIRAVSVVSTGTTQIHPQQPLGSRVPMYAWILGSRRWTPPRPVNAYVIEHTDGLVKFT
jgi:N-acyl homoserine lactone hydrolase